MLIDDLAEYDGKSVVVLEAIAKRYEDDPGAVSRAVALAASADGHTAAGATWLLRSWLRGGASIDSHDVVSLGHRLRAMTDPWARLHVCQTVGLLDIGPDVAVEFYDFLLEAASAPRPFLRAWGTDGLVRLAAAHPQYAQAAERALERAVADEAASVRARARQILAE